MTYAIDAMSRNNQADLLEELAHRMHHAFYMVLERHHIRVDRVFNKWTFKLKAEYARNGKEQIIAIDDDGGEYE